VPARAAEALLRVPFVERFARPQRAALGYLNHLVYYNCQNTLELLEGTGLRCPTITATCPSWWSSPAPTTGAGARRSRASRTRWTRCAPRPSDATSSGAVLPDDQRLGQVPASSVLPNSVFM